MNKFIAGVICTVGVLCFGGAMYKKGVNDGIEETTKMMEFANKLVKSVEKNYEGA